MYQFKKELAFKNAYVHFIVCVSLCYVIRYLNVECYLLFLSPLMYCQSITDYKYS